MQQQGIQDYTQTNGNMVVINLRCKKHSMREAQMIKAGRNCYLQKFDGTAMLS